MEARFSNPVVEVVSHCLFCKSLEQPALQGMEYPRHQRSAEGTARDTWGAVGSWMLHLKLGSILRSIRRGPQNSSGSETVVRLRPPGKTGRHGECSLQRGEEKPHSQTVDQKASWKILRKH